MFQFAPLFFHAQDKTGLRLKDACIAGATQLHLAWSGVLDCSYFVSLPAKKKRMKERQPRKKKKDRQNESMQ